MDRKLDETAPVLSPHTPILLLGAGRLGTHFAFHLIELGFTHIHLWNRRALPPERARSLESLQAQGLKLHLGPTLPLVELRPRLILLTVLDDAIPQVAAWLATQLEAAKDPLPTQGRGPSPVILHCSGALDSGALQPLHSSGCALGSLHPLQSFAAPPRPGGLPGIFFALEGHEAAQSLGESLVEQLGGRVARLRPGGKLAYHTSAVIASNLLVALAEVAVSLMQQATTEASSAADCLEVLMPLVEGTVKNLRAKGLPQALTGPISRGDVGVIARQLELLHGQQVVPGVETGRVYRDLSRVALELARAQGLEARAADGILRLLEDSEPRSGRADPVRLQPNAEAREAAGELDGADTAEIAAASGRLDKEDANSEV